jgi:DNA polymerase III alpha subunit
MKINKYGIIGHNQFEIVDALKSNPELDIDNIFCTNPESFNESIDKLYLDFNKLPNWNDINTNLSEKDFHDDMQQKWRMPEKYYNFDIESWLLMECKSNEQISRVKLELDLYNKFKLLPLLKYLKYLIDTIRQHNIVLGVGRGSSCASYCLYLIGIHRVDSIKYKLDITEFLRENEPIINMDEIEGEHYGKNSSDC